MKRIFCKSISIILCTLMLAGLCATVVAGEEALSAAEGNSEIGYSAALVERVPLGKIPDIKEFDTVIATAYKITDADGLVKFANLVKGDDNLMAQTFEGLCVYLANDIDLSAIENFEPIGGWQNSQWAKPYFCGTFDGQGYRIENLKMTVPTSLTGTVAVNGYFGLFRNLGTGAVIRNLVIGKSCVFSGGRNADVGPMAALAGAIDTDKKFSADETSTVTISNVYNQASVVSGGGVAGGLIAYAKSANLTVDHCTNSGTVSLVNGAKGQDFMGLGVAGIIGKIGEIVKNGAKDYYINVSVTNCRNTGSITSRQAPAAGIVGSICSGATKVSLTVKQCINNGAITNTATAGGVGGILGLNANTDVGQKAITIKECVNYGAVKPFNTDTSADEIGVCVEGATLNVSDNLKKAGQVDSTLEEALAQDAKPIADPPDDTPDNNEDDNKNQGGNADKPQSDDNKDPNHDSSKPNGENTAGDQTGDANGGQTSEASDKKGCKSSVGMLLPILGCAIAFVVFRKRQTTPCSR